jgi:hypothetical protein
MSMPSGGPSERVSAFAPTEADPPRIADATVKAVNKLGAVTAGEVEKTADDIMRGAAEIAERLGQLAEAIRHHTQIASENVEEFCGKATSVFESVIALQSGLLTKKDEIDAGGADDIPLPLPKLDKERTGRR